MRSVLALLLMAAVFLAANSVADPQPHASAGRLEINPRLAELKTEVAMTFAIRSTLCFPGKAWHSLPPV